MSPIRVIGCGIECRDLSKTELTTEDSMPGSDVLNDWQPEPEPNNQEPPPDPHGEFDNRVSESGNLPDDSDDD